MEKNRIRPIKTGKSFRMSYSRQEEVLEMPNLIEVQKDSYKWFLDEGLKEVAQIFHNFFHRIPAFKVVIHSGILRFHENTIL